MGIYTTEQKGQREELKKSTGDPSNPISSCKNYYEKNKNENGMEAGLKITSLRDSSRSNTGHGSSDGDGNDLSN